MLQCMCRVLMVGCLVGASAHASNAADIPEAGLNEPAALKPNQAGVADRETIARILRDSLPQTIAWNASEIEIRSIEGLSPMDLPSGSYQLRLSSDASPSGRRKVMASIEVVQDGNVVRSFWVTADLAVRASILTASQPIPLQKVIAPEDVLEQVVEIPDIRASYARRPGDLIGKVARRRFAQGAPLTGDAFEEPVLIRQGETVQLRLERNGIVLTSSVKAEQDGKLGQMITVRNLDFATRLKAQVTGRATVRLQ